jgi:sortase A
VVTGLESYQRADAPLYRIFGPAPGRHLNLITCTGIFDRARQEYESNLVVYAEAAR